MKTIFRSVSVIIGLLIFKIPSYAQAPHITYPGSAGLTAGTAFTISPANSGGAVPATTYGQVTVFAGNSYGTPGYVNATGSSARFHTPEAVIGDGSGNLYVADADNNAIRKITSSGVVTTFAGSATGTSGYKDTTVAAAATFNEPDNLTFDSSGNLYVADYGNNAIRKITPAGVVTTFYHTAGTFGPAGLVFDSSGNLVVAAQDANKILRISPAGVATTLAGSSYGYANGTGTAAEFEFPAEIKLDTSGNIYVADYLNNAVRKVTPAGVVTTYAGSSVSGNTGGFADGVGTAAKFNNLTGLAIAGGGVIYVADFGNNDIRRILPDGTVDLIAGSTTQVNGYVDGTGTAAQFHGPVGMYIDGSGTGYIAEYSNNRVRKIVLTGYTLKGTLPAGLAFDPTTGIISGTPTGTITTTTDTITAYNASGYSTATITFSAGTAPSPTPSISYNGSTALTAGTAFTISPANTGGAVPATTYGQVTTLAGNGAAGYVNATGSSAEFNIPYGSVMDASGNLYVADASNNAIRKVTQAGVVTTFAGSTTGVSGLTNATGTSARFNNPQGIAIDGSGNFFVSDYGNNVIRKITPAGVVTTFYAPGGSFGPTGLCFDSSGDLIVAAQDESRIIKVTAAGAGSTIAGSSYGYTNATGTAAQFEMAEDVQTDSSGNIYVADYLNNAIRKITPAGVVTTFAGSATSGNTGAYLEGVGTAARFNNPTGVALGNGNILYVADLYNNDIRRIMPDGSTALVAGSATQAAGIADGIGTAASFHSPVDLYIDGTGTGWVADGDGNEIRKLVLTGYTLKGTLPAGLAFDPTTGIISGTPTGTITTITDTITAYNASGYSTATVTFSPAPALPTITYGGTTSYTYNVGTPITTLTPTVTGSPVPYTGYTTTYAGNGTGASIDGTRISASLFAPSGLAIDRHGNMYITDQGTYKIRKITPSGMVITMAGDGFGGFINGTGTAAVFNHPVGMDADTAGNVYIADEDNNAIRKMTPAAEVTTFAGGTQGTADSTGTAAQFYNPTGVVIDTSGNIYVSDYFNNLIRKITPAGVVTTVAGSTQGSADGTGAAAQFYHPADITIDTAGNLYVADRGNNKIRRITPAGVVTTVAGNGTAGFADGAAATAEFNAPDALSADRYGNLYITDYLNNRVRRIDTAGVVSTLTGSAATGATNGMGNIATFNDPAGSAFDPWGNFYVEDRLNHLIRQVVTTPYTISPGLPAGLSFDPQTGIISGTPAAGSDTVTYTITAYNMAGTGSTRLTFKVIPPAALTPSLDQNYVITRVPRIDGIVNDSTRMAAEADQDKMQTSIQYLDGLGRPVQTVQVKASPAGNDLVAPQAYDPYGREVTKYLPYVPGSGSFGSYRPAALSGDQQAFYIAPPAGVSAITDPYAQTAFDNSPLDRPLEQGAPGVPWQLTGVSGGGHTVRMVYSVNNDTSFVTDSVNGNQVARYYATVNSNLSRTLHSNGYYPAGTLTVTVSKDENWVSGRAGTVEEYKDIDGQVILKRQYNYTGSLQVLSTYYIYDDLGKLAFVLTPASGADVAGSISQTTLDNLCYQYRYDGLGRPVGRKIPGKGWEYTVYNVMDQPVATQDSLQRAANNWIFTKYDALGRAVLTGTWNNGGTAMSRDSLQTMLNGITVNLYEAPVNTGNGYTNVAWPTTNVTATLTTDYYDTYANIPGLPAGYTVTSGVSKLTRGLPTVKKTAVLNTPTDQLWDVLYYDDLGRTTQTYAQHYLGGTADTNNYDLAATTYNFTNQPTTVTRKHYTTASTGHPLVTIFNKYLYDHMGRKVKTWEQITNGSSAPDTARLISQIDYNEIGQVLTKHLGSTDSLNFLQDVAYTYNERGWLQGSSAPLFAMQLLYNTGTAKAYNGNIMYQNWGTPGSLTNSYTYTYDKLNRLLSGTSTSSNNESGITYDLMGNITALNRYTASTLTDQLSYTYTGNQLQSVADASGSNTGLVNGTTDYTWDGNGNMLTQNNTVNTGQNKSVTYNLLNLPQSVTVPNGTVTYTYDATGNKLRKVSVISGVTKTTDYISGIEYDGAATDTLNFIQTEEGKAAKSGSIYDYTYYLGDNLGNTRRTFGSKTGAAVLYQSDDYYPFGMEISNSLTSPKNEYLYNKKELQEELGQYDYGARFYDPIIGRWNVVDPLAEMSRRYSPYSYVENNPIRLIDVDGMWTSDGNGGVTTSDASEIQQFYNAMVGQQAAQDALSQTPGSGGQNNNQSKNKEKQEKKKKEEDRFKLPASVTNWQILQNFLFGTPIPGVPETNVMGGDDNPVAGLIEGPVGELEALSRSSVINKVINYLLDAEKSKGKFGIFEEALGFTKETGGLLAKQIVFDAGKAVDAGATQYGQKFTQVVTVTGTNGRKMEIMTVWLKSAKDNVVRLVTAYPAK